MRAWRSPGSLVCAETPEFLTGFRDLETEAGLGTGGRDAGDGEAGLIQLPSPQGGRYSP